MFVDAVTFMVYTVSIPGRLFARDSKLTELSVLCLTLVFLLPRTLGWLRLRLVDTVAFVV